MSDINQRNAATVFAKLAEMDNMMREQQLQLNRFAEAMAAMQARLDAMQDTINQLRIAAMGSGPTKREN